jgi:hypothetical protein
MRSPVDGKKAAATRVAPPTSYRGCFMTLSNWLMRQRGMTVVPTKTANPKIFGAGEGIRTLDPNLGKVVLYP